MKKTIKLRICKSASASKGWMFIITNNNSDGLVLFTHKEFDEVVKFAGKLFNRPKMVWTKDHMNDYETSIEVTSD